MPRKTDPGCQALNIFPGDMIFCGLCGQPLKHASLGSHPTRCPNLKPGKADNGDDSGSIDDASKPKAKESDDSKPKVSPVNGSSGDDSTTVNSYLDTSGLNPLVGFVPGPDEFGYRDLVGRLTQELAHTKALNRALVAKAYKGKQQRQAARVALIAAKQKKKDAETVMEKNDAAAAAAKAYPFIVHRKAAKRTLPWDLVAGELHLMSPPQLEDIRAARKKPRLEEPFSASTNEAAAELSSHDTAVSLPAADSDDAGADPVKGNRTTGSWTPEVDAKLNSAVTNNRINKSGKEYRTDWAAVAALVPYRTKSQCRRRWRCALEGDEKQVHDGVQVLSELEDALEEDEETVPEAQQDVSGQESVAGDEKSLSDQHHAMKGAEEQAQKDGVAVTLDTEPEPETQRVQEVSLNETVTNEDEAPSEQQQVLDGVVGNDDESPSNKTRIRCYYWPRCQKDPVQCGGWKPRLCRYVQIVNDDVLQEFLKEKKLAQKKRIAKLVADNRLAKKMAKKHRG